MTKSKRIARRMNASAEQAKIEKAVEAEVETPKVKRVVILPEGVTGAQLKRKVVAQTSELAAKVNPDLAGKAKEAKDIAKDAGKVAPAAKAKATTKKADKAEKPAKKEKVAGKYVNNITSMEKLGDYCFAQGWDEKNKKTVDAFVEGYKLKGVTDMKFITPRIAIYMNIARKRAAKVAEALTKAEAKVVKEKVLETAK